MIDPFPMLNLAEAEDAAHFRQYGYVVKDLLDATEIERLRSLWSDHEPAVPSSPYASSLFSSDRALRAGLSIAVAAIVAPKLATVCPDGMLVYAGFASKAACEPAGIVPFHQDPSFVDEARWGSANIWIPLVDLDAANGPLWAVPGSHRLNRGRRGFNQRFAYDSHEAELTTLARPIHMRAGQAILFAHTLFHFSPANTSPRPRPAAGGLVAPRDAPLFYNFVDPEDPDWIEVYAATPDLFLAAPISTRPDATLLDRARTTVDPWDPARLRGP